MVGEEGKETILLIWYELGTIPMLSISVYR